jgi:hypothetical protein
MHSGQVTFPRYTGSGAFSGTATANLSVDSNGNILTTAIGSSLTGGATNYVARWASSTTLTTGSLFDNGTNVGIGSISPAYKLDVTGDIRATGAVYANANGQMYFRGGDDAELWDINIANTLGVYGQQDQTVASIKLGSNGGTLSGRSGSIGIGITTPVSGTLHVNGNVFATSYTGSLFGTSSWANNAVTASYVLNAVSASFAATASSADNFLVRQNATASNLLVNNTITAQTLVVQTVTSSIVYSSGSNIFGNRLTDVQQFTGSLRVTGSGNHYIIGSNVGINTIAPAYRLDVAGDGNFTANLTATGSIRFPSLSSSNQTNVVSYNTTTGQLFYQATSSLSVTTASYALTASSATNFTITNQLIFDGTLTDYASVASSIAGSNNLFTQAVGSYTSAFFKYTVSNGSNARSGEVMAVFSGSTVQYTDNSTLDIGSTTPVTCSVSVVSSDVQFNIQTNTSGWRIKSIATFM